MTESVIYPLDLLNASTILFKDFGTISIEKVFGETDGIAFKGKYNTYKYYYETKEIVKVG